MKKTDLVAAVAAKAGISKKDADAAVSALVATITDALAEGDSVQLVGFGTFEMKTRAARTGRNPQTGAAMKIAASQTLSFKPSSVFKSAVPAKKTCKKGGCKKK